MKSIVIERILEELNTKYNELFHQQSLIDEKIRIIEHKIKIYEALSNKSDYLFDSFDHRLYRIMNIDQDEYALCVMYNFSSHEGAIGTVYLNDVEDIEDVDEEELKAILEEEKKNNPEVESIINDLNKQAEELCETKQ